MLTGPIGLLWPFWSLVLAGYHWVNATLGSKAKIITMEKVDFWECRL